LIETRATAEDISVTTALNMALLTECETLWLFGNYKHCTPLGCRVL